MQKKRKCDKEAEPLIRVDSKLNTTTTDSSSIIPNSQESVDISQENVVQGKRKRKPRNNI